MNHFSEVILWIVLLLLGIVFVRVRGQPDFMKLCIEWEKDWESWKELLEKYKLRIDKYETQVGLLKAHVNVLKEKIELLERGKS